MSNPICLLNKPLKIPLNHNSCIGWMNPLKLTLNHHFGWLNPMRTNPWNHYFGWLPSGKHTKSYWTWPFSSWVFPWKMVIFHSYVAVYQRVTMDLNDPRIDLPWSVSWVWATQVEKAWPCEQSNGSRSGGDGCRYSLHILFIYTIYIQYIYIYWLVGGLEHEFYDFPYIGNNQPIRLSYVSEGLKPPTSIYIYTHTHTIYVYIYICRGVCVYTYNYMRF